MDDRQVTLTFRVPEPERRAFRILAFQLGLSVQTALRQAFDAWMTSAAAEAPDPVSLRKPAGTTPPGEWAKSEPPWQAADHGAAESPFAGWSGRALALKWSQCPAAERLDTEEGEVWVFRGTRTPLAALFLGLEQGQWVDDVVAQLQLNEPQVDIVMQFVGEQMEIPGL